MSELARRSPLSQALTVLATAAVLVHLVGLYRTAGPPSPSWFPQADKVEHVVGFGAPVFLILVARQWSGRAVGRPLTGRFAGVVVAIFGLHAVVSELIQHFFYVSRTGDPLDAVADSLGVALGSTLAWRVSQRRSEHSGSRPTGPRDAG